MINMRPVLMFTIFCFSWIYAQAQMESLTADQRSTLEKIIATQRLEAGTKTKYSFIQTKHTPLLAKDAVSKGYTTIEGRKKMTWVYTDPVAFSIMMEDGKMYMEKNGKKETIGKMSGKGAIIKTMSSLSNLDELVKTKMFDMQYNESMPNISLTLTPTRRDMKKIIQTIVLEFDKKSYQVKAVTINENSESYTLIEFSEKKD